MRLVAVELAGFRGFRQATRIDLDADAVVVIGTNGQGKTSIFDALLWGITGKVPRLADPSSGVRNLWTDENLPTSVAVTCRSEQGELVEVRRQLRGSEQSVTLHAGGQVYHGSAAHTHLVERFWPVAAASEDPGNALLEAMTRAVYLQQDRLKDFLEADNPEVRFRGLSGLLGATRIGELQRALESERNSWSRALTQLREEQRERQALLLAAETELGEVDGALDSLREGIEDGQWKAFWVQARRAGVTVAAVDSTEPNAPEVLDNALRQLRTSRSQLVLRRAENDRRHQAILSIAEQPLDLDSLSRDVDAKLLAVNASKQQLQLALEENARLEEVASRQRAAASRLGQFASLALEMLAERCPVCGQAFDRDETEARLKIIAENAHAPMPVPAINTQELMASIQRLSQIHLEAESALAGARRDAQRRELAMSQAAEAVGVPPKQNLPELRTLLRSLVDEQASLAAELADLESLGESLAVALAATSLPARRAALSNAVALQRAERNRIIDSVAERQRVHDIATKLIDAVRQTGDQVVTDELQRLDPLLQRIYRAIDPHPAFRVVRLLSDLYRGRGRLSTRVEDLKDSDIFTTNPSDVLSSSQATGLAVALFTAFNLGMPALPLQAALLDDPLQSLDDVHLLGMIDLLRRVKRSRQIILATHDASLGELLGRKLRPIEEGSTLVVTLQAWDRAGVSVSSRRIVPSLPALRLVV